MKANQNICLFSEKVRLVPYKKEHVAKYHTWMQDTYLQQMTASEPLTEEEEYLMQKSWEEDEKKCTFIMLDNELLDSDPSPPHIRAMVGDVNLFLNDMDDPRAAEIEVMVAVLSSRRKGLAEEAICLMLMYGVQYLGLRSFHAKISSNNMPSQKLFQKLGFVRVSESKVFQEVTFNLSEGSSAFKHIQQRVNSLHIVPYAI